MAEDQLQGQPTDAASPPLNGAALARIEARLDRIESRFDRFEERLRRVEADILETKARVALLPTAWTLLAGGAGIMLAVMAFALALVRIGVTS
ncbi:MAG: hypothetical protein RMK64_09600 [Rhodovarius sp.]|nr:hemolysin XhlA family protein [Rhodovarius sp.]MDW8315212.1 hypothetical protein [Rhodovarius sp.]